MTKNTQQTSETFLYTYTHKLTGEKHVINALSSAYAWCALCAKIGVNDKIILRLTSTDDQRLMGTPEGHGVIISK